jgi:hypothetical protein
MEHYRGPEMQPALINSMNWISNNKLALIEFLNVHFLDDSG